MAQHEGAQRRRSSALVALLATLGLLLLTFQPAFALTRSLAGVIDWHKPLIGVPRYDHAPKFHELLQGGTEHILTVTERNVVASLEPTDGSIRWRHQFNVDNDRILYLQVDQDDVVIYSDTAIRCFSAQSGSLRWEYYGEDNDVDGLPRHGAFLPNSVLVLTSAGNVHALERSTGRKVWENEEINASSHLYAILSNDVVHLVGGESEDNVFISHLDANGHQSGSKQSIDSAAGSSSDILCSTDSCLFLNAKRNELRVVPFMVDQKKTPSKPSKTAYTHVFSVDLDTKGHFLGERKDGRFDVIKLQSDSYEIVWTFEACDPSSHSPSVWRGYADSKGNVWVIRTYWSYALQMMQVESHNLEHRDGYVNTGHTFPFDDKKHGQMVDIAYQLTTHEPIVDRFRAVIMTSTGSLQLWQQEQLVWSREEGLAEIAAITTLELPEKKVEDVRNVLDHEGLVERVLRHAVESIHLPAYLLRFIQRFTSGSYKQALSAQPLAPGSLYRDQFGFQRLAIAVTSLGKVYAIDTANGNVVWDRLLVQSASVLNRLAIEGVWAVRDATEGLHPVVAVVWHQASEAAHLDAFTGEFIESGCKSKGPQANTLFEGPPKAVFPLPAQHCKSKIRALAVVDGDDQAHLFPFCKKIEGDVRKAAADITFTAVDRPRDLLLGYALSSHGIDGRFRAQQLWDAPLQSSLPQPVTQGPVASFGRVLGDRSTLYKYLNPHLIALPSKTGSTSTVSLLDARTGEAVFSTASINTDPNSEVLVTLVENWLVYSYVQSPIEGESTGGQRLVSVELFETNSTSPRAISRTFILPTTITSLTTTSSRYGISLKDIIYTNTRGQVAYIPRRMLDPRRPDIPSKADREEMLIPFDPLLIADPKRTLSHANDLMGTKHVVASPALLESTSLLFAYGLDLFGSRITPSGTFDILSDAFNKTQLLLTIAALVAGLIFAKPAVDRRLLRSRWY